MVEKKSVNVKSNENCQLRRFESMVCRKLFIRWHNSGSEVEAFNCQKVLKPQAGFSMTTVVASTPHEPCAKIVKRALILLAD